MNQISKVYQQANGLEIAETSINGQIAKIEITPLPERPAIPLPERIEQLTPMLKKIASVYATADYDPDDIYQSTCEAILTKCKPTDTKSYIIQLANWHARNLVNKAATYTRYVSTLEAVADDTDEEMDVLEAIIAEDSTPEEHLIQSEEIKNLSEILTGLDRTTRTIISGMVDGLTHQQIADKLGLGRTAVTNRVLRLRTTLTLAGYSA